MSSAYLPHHECRDFALAIYSSPDAEISHLKGSVFTRLRQVEAHVTASVFIGRITGFRRNNLLNTYSKDAGNHPYKRPPRLIYDRRALSNELLLRAVTGTSFFTIRDLRLRRPQRRLARRAWRRQLPWRHARPRGTSAAARKKYERVLSSSTSSCGAIGSGPLSLSAIGVKSASRTPPIGNTLILLVQH